MGTVFNPFTGNLDKITGLKEKTVEIEGDTLTPSAKFKNGSNELLNIQLGTNSATLDVVSAEPANLASNGTFETDLTGWTTSGTPWWLAGGVSVANAVAAYQPIGAADLSGSYINLANPGTYNAAPGVAPTFDASTGWTFNGSNQYLSTGILPASSWSVFVRYSGASSTDGIIIGAYKSSAIRYDIRTRWGGTFRSYYFFGAAGFGGAFQSSGVIGNAGSTFYFNSNVDAVVAGSGSMSDYPLWIGALNYVGSGLGYYNGKIQSVAIYNTTLTADQVSAITTAMNALSGSTPPQYNPTSTRDTGTKYAGSASAKVSATSSGVTTFTQSLNVGDTNVYTIAAYAYTTGAAVTSSDVELYYNGAAITTNYTSVGSGWYLLTGTVTGANASRTWGVEVKASKTVYIDNFSITAGSGAATTLYVSNSGTGIASLNVEAETTLNAGLATNKALIAKAASAQTANIAEFQNSSGTALASVSKDGALIVNDGGADADTRMEGDNDPNLLYLDAGNDRVGHGTATPTAKVHNVLSDAGTNSIASGEKLDHITSGTATTGFGVSQAVGLEKADGTLADAAVIDVLWNDASTPKADVVISAYDTAKREVLRGRGDGGGKIAFLGNTPVAKASHIADAKTDYTTGDLDQESEIISAINTTNTKTNAILKALEDIGIISSS